MSNKFAVLALLLLVSTAAIHAKRVKIYGSIQQTYIPPACICGESSNTAIYAIPDDAPDCVPHVLTTLSCGIYTYSLSTFICNTYVGTMLSYDNEDDVHCMTNYGIGLGCANQTMNGICRMKYDVVIQDILD